MKSSSYLVLAGNSKSITKLGTNRGSIAVTYTAKKPATNTKLMFFCKILLTISLKLTTNKPKSLINIIVISSSISFLATTIITRQNKVIASFTVQNLADNRTQFLLLSALLRTLLILHLILVPVCSQNTTPLIQSVLT